MSKEDNICNWCGDEGIRDDDIENIKQTGMCYYCYIFYMSELGRVGVERWRKLKIWKKS